MWTLVWMTSIIFGRHDTLEPTDRLIPPGWVGNPWGPEANEARKAGTIPPLPNTPAMKRWDDYARKYLRDGDVLFRRGDARLLFGYFPFSRWLANVDGSLYSHMGLLAIEDGEPVVYDTTKAGPRRQPFRVWVLDNTGPLGIKRPRPDLQGHIPGALAFCREMYRTQPPFDYDLGMDNSALYCVEMVEKSYRSTGLTLSEPIRVGDMENFHRYPIIIFVFTKLSTLNPDTLAFFPGNERHGLWASPALVTVVDPSARAKASSTSTAPRPGPAAPRPNPAPVAAPRPAAAVPAVATPGARPASNVGLLAPARRGN